MERTPKSAFGIAAGLVAAVLVLVVTSSAESIPSKTPRLSWPKNRGVYLAKSSESIPTFPRALSGFRSELNMDFWGKPFNSRGTLRIFERPGPEYQTFPTQ
jgi:hypothetical protein